jgi:RNA polymerase sigma-70 factor (ECF subfamily)
MSTTCSDSNDAYHPALGVSRNQEPTSAKPEIGNALGSQLLAGSIRHGSNGASNDCDASEDDLITAAQRGDQNAFAELCRRHSAVTKRKIFSILRNYEDTEDVLQDVLLRAYTHLTSFRRSCKFSSWLTTIGVNSALMILRKGRIRGETYASRYSLHTETPEPQEFEDRAPGPEGIYLKQQTILLVRREIEKLKPSLRSVVSHYYESDCSVEETAIAHEISLGAAKSRLLRGRVRLRSSLTRHGYSSSGN